jgi:putative transposase
MQMYLEGVSTRKVRDITEALCGLEIGKSQVSALVQKLDEEIRPWRERAIENSYPYLMMDARYEKVRRGGEVISQGVLIVLGISAEGLREVLGVWVADSESEASWGEVFSDLSRRGLRGVRYVVSDDHQGMPEPSIGISRCNVAALPSAFRAQATEPHGGEPCNRPADPGKAAA